MSLEDLKKPFDPAAISWRVGSTTKDKSKGMALAYIDARDVQDRLDEVCGVDGWQCRYVPMHDKKTVCEVGVRINSEWIWKADGAGDSDVEAEKGALSDAFKRAAVRWGIGRYLYDLESPWVECDTYEKNGQVYVKGIKAGEFPKLRALLAGKAPKAAPAPAPAPTPPKPPAKITPTEWADKASAEIAALHTKADLSAWLQKNNKAVEALHDTDKSLYNAINQKISLRNDELQRKAA